MNPTEGSLAMNSAAHFPYEFLPHEGHYDASGSYFPIDQVDLSTNLGDYYGSNAILDKLAQNSALQQEHLEFPLQDQYYWRTSEMWHPAYQPVQTPSFQDCRNFADQDVIPTEPDVPTTPNSSQVDALDENRLPVRPPQRYTREEIMALFRERWKILRDELERKQEDPNFIREDKTTKQRFSLGSRDYGKYWRKLQGALAKELRITLDGVERITLGRRTTNEDLKKRFYLDRDLERERLEEEKKKGNIDVIPLIYTNRNYPVIISRRPGNRRSKKNCKQETPSPINEDHTIDMGTDTVTPLQQHHLHNTARTDQSHLDHVLHGHQSFSTHLDHQQQQPISTYSVSALQFNPSTMIQNDYDGIFWNGLPAYPTQTQGSHHGYVYGVPAYNYYGFPPAR